MRTLILSKKKITHTKNLISQQQLTNGAFLPVCVVNTFVHIFALSILLNGKTRRHLIPQFNNAILLSGSCPHTDITPVSYTHLRQPVQVLGSQVASPVEVAEAIFQGAARRRRLLVLSNVNWRARLLARFFPRLFEKLLVPRLSGLKPQP